jgi:hypothetical protein
LADKNKNEKISSIINEEKEHIKNEINKLKKEIEKRDIKEEHYLAEIKNGKDQCNKLEVKLNSSTKDY